MATKDDFEVKEMQGLYGPFTIAERVVQKIWLRQDFDVAAARLLDGRKLTIHRTGSWNLLAGPDFRGARLSIDGREAAGDVEVHFHATDWRAHGHDADPAYDDVVLHVVMFAPSDAQAVARSRSGEPLPTLVLLPLLHRGLEEYASDDALENLTARDTAEKLAELSVLPQRELRGQLLARARRRWDQKTGYARLRIEKLGAVGTAHHTALEILGYRHNRAAMLSVAARHPLTEWSREVDPEAIYAAHQDAWQAQGVRPANHPRRRLHQYAEWVAKVPDWPMRASVLLGSLTEQVEAPAAQARKKLKLGELRQKVITDITGNAIGGTRIDNLVCDGLLPLTAAESGRDLFPVWFHWFVGDIPQEVRQGLGTLGLAGADTGPQCHGWAQGLLGWMLDRDARASG